MTCSQLSSTTTVGSAANAASIAVRGAADASALSAAATTASTSPSFVATRQVDEARRVRLVRGDR